MSVEHLQKVESFEVRRLCDCGGEMKAGHSVLTSNPSQYPHVCAVCGKRENLPQRYPHVRHVPISEGG